nr:uncharacterized protein LOC104112165 [Nicotiana tomentosiformis]
MADEHQLAVFCEVCGEGHTSDACPVNPEPVYFVGNANRGQDNQYQYGSTYNPNWRNHPNVSWSENQGAQNQYNPQVPQQQNRPPQAEQPTNSMSHIEEMLKKLMADKHAQTIDLSPNPKAQVNPVTLRNGRVLEEVPTKTKYTVSPEGELVPKPVAETEKESKRSYPVIVIRPPPPFPQRLQKQKDNAKYKKFLDILIQVRVNFYLVEILQEVPKYVRYLKDIVSNKRRHTKFEIVALAKECSTRVKSKLPPRLKDPGSFTIPLSLGKQELADMSLVMPEGIIEVVLVRAGNFIFPANFIVLDYKADEEVPIILRRPLLATGGAIIDVREWKLKMRVAYARQPWPAVITSAMSKTASAIAFLRSKFRICSSCPTMPSSLLRRAARFYGPHLRFLMRRCEGTSNKKIPAFP